jgi:hypothetical protein
LTFEKSLHISLHPSIPLFIDTLRVGQNILENAINEIPQIGL